MTCTDGHVLLGKYRNLPRAYDLGHIRAYLTVLHKCPIPLVEIEKRKLNSSLEAGMVTRDTAEEILEWKGSRGLQSADESEYRYLLRDLGLIADRAMNPEVDLVLPLGGDGPAVGSFLLAQRRARMFFLTEMGERLYSECVLDRPAYESSIFWLIIRNKYYLPLIQQVILNPVSCRTTDISELVETDDSVSKGCALQWLSYFGISGLRSGGRLDSDMLARRLLAAAILEMNRFLKQGETYYVKELDRLFNETFSLSPSATDFVAALDVVFRYADRSIIQGYTSGRGDTCLLSYPNISIVRIIGRIPLSIAFQADAAELRKITRYAVEQ